MLWVEGTGHGHSSEGYYLLCRINQGKINGLLFCYERREKLIHATISVDLENTAPGRRGQTIQFIGERWPGRLLKRTDMTSYTWSNSIHMT